MYHHLSAVRHYSMLIIFPPRQQRSLLESTTNWQAAAATVDPTAALSNVLGNFLGSPAILAIPIVAALGVATLFAYLIFAYAQPAANDDDYDF